MGETAVFLLLSISSLLGIHNTPNADPNWHIIKNWHQENGYSNFQAESKSISKECHNDKNSIIVLPQIIHGIHKIFLNGQLILESGDSTFEKASPFYFAPTVSCLNINTNDVIRWEVISYTNYFARFSHYPKVHIKPIFSFISFLKGIPIYLLLSGFIISLALISLIIYTDKKAIPAIQHYFTGALFLVIYMLSCVSTQLNLNFSMLIMHKIADSFLWMCMILTFYFFLKNKLLNKAIFNIHLAFSVISLLIIFTGNTGDEVQLGTSLPFVTTLASFIVISYNAIKQYVTFGKDKKNIYIFIGTMSVIAFGINDMLVIFGLIDAALIFPFGMSILILTTALSINIEIKNTYNQRDELLSSLEDKVNEKTKSLVDALDKVKKSQADLIESSRLASLGTLSAGIAHEINNSINFIHGAIVPLERKVLKLVPESDKESIKRLFNVIKDGTNLTIGIVQSLRSYTGLNQAEIKEINIRDVVNSVTTILKSRLRDCELIIDIPENLLFLGHQVGLNQIIMNLITNALDALPEVNPSILISAHKINGELFLTFKDNGVGIPESIKSRIFDPFYTTKNIGKGTGLGLHIVKKEVERYNGRIELYSKLNEGTTFTIHLIESELELKEAA